MITRYQNLIKSCYLQSGYLEQEVHLKEPESKSDYSISEPQQELLLTKVVTWNQKFITKNQKIKVITRYQNLVKVYF